MSIISKIKSIFSKPKGKTFWTADLHFSHRNVIQYCNRPWADKDAMNEGLVALWNKQVSKHDTVYVLGDFSLSPKAVIDFAHRLNGKKILVCGNHDACFDFPNKRKAESMRLKYLKDFESVHMQLTYKLSNGITVLMSHLPYANEESLVHDTRYLDKRPKDKGMVLLHGHLHGRYIKSGRMIDVGVDGKLTLYTEDDIITLLSDKRDYIPSRITNYINNLPQRTKMKGESL